MHKTRPVFLNLWQIKFPIMAIVSIFHRISGVLLFIALPLLLWMLRQSLLSQASYDALVLSLQQPLLKVLVWLTLSAAAYHLIAGVRHLMMDMGLGESLKGGRVGAYLVLACSLFAVIALGAWLW